MRAEVSGVEKGTIKGDNMTTELSATSVTHAHIKRVLHPTLGVEVDGRTCVRTLRFRRRVKLDHLEFRYGWGGRWQPNVPAHPAHLLVSVLDGARWRVVKEVEVPPDPRIAGEGLDPATPPEEMDKLFNAVRSEPIRIELDGLDTDHIRVECDREQYPVWPNSGFRVNSWVSGSTLGFQGQLLSCFRVNS